MDPTVVLNDLRAEHEALDILVAPLGAADWSSLTPSPNWTVAHEIAHLTYFDRTATLAIVEPAAFAAVRDALFDAVLVKGIHPDAFTLDDLMELTPEELLEAWRTARAELLAAGDGLGAGDRVEWYGPSMSAASFLTARLMETWAHGQDIADALGSERESSDRLAHIARLGLITRNWS